MVGQPSLSVKVCLELDVYSNKASLAAVLKVLTVFLFSCVQYYLLTEANSVVGGHSALAYPEYRFSPAT
jgi:hypothetical protein